MKKNLLLLAMMAFATLGFTACSNEDDDETSDENIVLAEPDFKSDAIKLRFDEPVEYDNEFDITELELTESGNYLLKLEKKRDIEVKGTRAGISSYKYLFDSFLRLEAGMYKLLSFGTVTIEQSGSKYIVTLNFNGKTVTVYATRIFGNITAGQKTTNLCRTWKVVSTRVKIDGESGFYQEDGCDLNSILTYMKQHADISDNIDANQQVTNIIFSYNGTFMIRYANRKTDKATWQWEDIKKGTFKYTWDASDMGYSFINGQAEVKIKPIGTPSQLYLYGTVKKNGENKKTTITVNIK